MTTESGRGPNPMRRCLFLFPLLPSLARAKWCLWIYPEMLPIY